MDKEIQFFNTTIVPSVIDSVSETLKSTRISAGLKCDLFEKNLSNLRVVEKNIEGAGSPPPAARPHILRVIRDTSFNKRSFYSC